MSTNFHIDIKKQSGNLHVSPIGDFDGNSAWELINLLDDQYDGTGRVVIDTRRLSSIDPFGCSTFQCRLNLSRLPSNRLVFLGERGHEIAPKGSTVAAIPKKHRCKGNCKDCACSKKKANVRVQHGSDNL
jgi:anti-anti-sigma regulatory factor